MLLASSKQFEPFSPRLMSQEDYWAVPAWNWSLLKSGRESMAQLAHDRATPSQPTKALTFGQIAHCAAFEPDEFSKRYTVVPADFFDAERLNRVTREGKMFYSAWLEAGGAPFKGDADGYKAAVFVAENPGRQVVSEAVYERALAIGAAARSNRLAAPYVCGGKYELAMAWVDSATGLPCKGRIDALVELEIVVEVDLKSAATIAKYQIERAAEKYGYLHQRAFYADGLKAHGIDSRAVIVAVKSKPAHDVGVFRVPDSAVESARAEVQALLRRVAECESSGVWPGMYDSEQVIERPAWTLGDGAGWEIIEE